VKEAAFVPKRPKYYDWFACGLVLSFSGVIWGNFFFGQRFGSAWIWPLTALAILCIVGCWFTYGSTQSGRLAALRRAYKKGEISTEAYNVKHEDILQNHFKKKAN
jgi:hypothetical protein